MKAEKFDVGLFFRALADRTRLRLINLMSDGELCVCFCVEILKTNQPKISRHLAYLRRAGIVTARRDGKWMHYQLAQPAGETARRLLSETLTWVRNDPFMQKERRKLDGICCGVPPKRLRNAPRPNRDLVQLLQTADAPSRTPPRPSGERAGDRDS